jgi:crotonobetainyl-CoA:carnitine CoA-transferase CaiB-like acyl-CoA transferase
VTDRLLDGVRVLELAEDVAGPYGGKLLTDLGAEVVKVESTDGDPTRARGPFPTGRVDGAQSGLFHYLNGAKDLRRMDRAEPGARAAAERLCRWADVMLESKGSGAAERLGLRESLPEALNPRLVRVSISPFGLSGPQAQWTGNDMIAFHASGFAHGFPALQVESLDLPPLQAPSYAAALLAGELVAAAALHGLLLAGRDGRGAHLDVSLQEAIAALNQSQFNAMERTGEVRRQATASASNPTVSLLPASDGWVAISPREEHQWARWLTVMGDPAWGQEPRFATRRSRAEHWPALHALLAEWSVKRPRLEIFEAAQAARVACYPLGAPTDLFASPQLAAREFFQEEPGLPGLRVPGRPYRIETREGADRVPPKRPSIPVAGPVKPLAGVRIVDFSWVLTGPICTKFLAALGAEVIKIESRARPDLSQRDTSWEELNPSKKSITLNLTEEPARDLARRLIAVSDVVVENFSAGVMDRLGLGYQRLSEVNPSLIMASSSALGRTGPERERVAYGTLIQCFTGWAALSAHPGFPPRSAAGIWTDPLTAALETFLLMAAVWRQRATGQGCFFDISMAEATIAALPEPILAWSLNQELVEPRGNRDPLVAPQGAYPARGDDRWLAVSVQSDAAWLALCDRIGRPDLGADSGLRDAAGRRARHDEVDRAMAAWSRTLAPDAAAAMLQARGIAATPTLTPADVLTDRHLAARGFASHVDSLAGGRRATLGFPWLVDGARPADFRRPPDLGQHNREILLDLLGLDPVEYQQLIDAQIIY